MAYIVQVFGYSIQDITDTVFSLFVAAKSKEDHTQRPISQLIDPVCFWIMFVYRLYIYCGMREKKHMLLVTGSKLNAS